MSKKRSKYRFRFSSANAEVPQKYCFSFLTIFDKNAGHRVTKFYPVYHVSITYKFYFILFSLIRKKYFRLFYIRSFEVFLQRWWGRVVVRALDSKIKGPGSSLMAARTFFFVFFNTKIFRICGRRKVFFAQKSSAFFEKITT